MKQTTRIHADLTAILAELPPESVQALEQFARFLREQARRGQRTALRPTKKKTAYAYPTIPVPPSSVDRMIGVMPPVGGDALEDSEALYDGK